LVGAAGALKDAGATEILACCTHPVLSGSAIQKIEESVLSAVVVTDTIPLSPQAQLSPKIHVLSVAPLLSEAIVRTHREESVSSLFE